MNPARFYAITFGLFLGLCIWKFGNPVILDHIITPPQSAENFLYDSWPLRWANGIMLILGLAGGVLILMKRARWRHSKWLWALPVCWLAWQFLSATRTVDISLTIVTLWQFSGCVACYFLGAFLFGDSKSRKLLLIGILTAFTFCLIRAVDQKLFEYPTSYQLLVEGEKCAWTNFPPNTVLAMKEQQVIVVTNGLEVANPIIMEKFRKGRVSGTLVYPNALAGLILLLMPIALVLAVKDAKQLRGVIRFGVILLTLFLCGGALYWSGSKLGWLLGLGMGVFYLLRFNLSTRWKFVALSMVLLFGLGIFVLRFQHYFAGGAKSMGARLDYWSAAVRTVTDRPIWGTGPGTFQRSYYQLKSPDSEMARLTHNDYLQQFSDSGLLGGVFYLIWITGTLIIVGKSVWQSGEAGQIAVFFGVCFWFLQGFGEFGLYIIAPSWIAFTLMGSLVGSEINQFDKK